MIFSCFWVSGKYINRSNIKPQIKIPLFSHAFVQVNDLYNIENSDIQHTCILKVFTTALRNCSGIWDMSRKMKFSACSSTPSLLVYAC